ncbi:gamma-glutamyltransferase, partial [Hansschlegelia beijingensis]
MSGVAVSGRRANIADTGTEDAMHRRIILGLVLALSVQAAVGQEAPQTSARLPPEIATGFTPKPLVQAKRWMAAVANPYAAAAAAEMLREGGSAVDAAIAAQLVLGLVEPQSSGLGGGAFLVAWDAARKELTTFDGRETAPAAATASLFQDVMQHVARRIGPLSVDEELVVGQAVDDV